MRSEITAELTVRCGENQMTGREKPNHVSIWVFMRKHRLFSAAAAAALSPSTLKPLQDGCYASAHRSSDHSTACSQKRFNHGTSPRGKRKRRMRAPLRGVGLGGFLFSLSVLTTDNTGCSKYGLVEQIHTRPGTKRGSSM